MNNTSKPRKIDRTKLKKVDMKDYHKKASTESIKCMEKEIFKIMAKEAKK